MHCIYAYMIIHLNEYPSTLFTHTHTHAKIYGASISVNPQFNLFVEPATAFISFILSLWWIVKGGFLLIHGWL